MNIPLQIWYDLIFVKLDLESLINIGRVCKNFYNYNRLQNLIRVKKEETFGDIGRKHWNNLRKIKDKFIFRKEFTEKHEGKILLLVKKNYLSDVVYFLGVYSSLHKLLKNFALLPKVNSILQYNSTNRSLTFHFVNIYTLDDHIGKIIGVKEHQLNQFSKTLNTTLTFYLT